MTSFGFPLRRTGQCDAGQTYRHAPGGLLVLYRVNHLSQLNVAHGQSADLMG